MVQLLHELPSVCNLIDFPANGWSLWISSLPSLVATVSAARALETTGSAIVAVATPDVFSDLPSGLRVESGDSLDLLLAGASILTSSTKTGKGGVSNEDGTQLPLNPIAVLDEDGAFS